MVAGNGEAIGSYRGIPYTGLMAWKLKDWIDRHSYSPLHACLLLAQSQLQVFSSLI